MDQWDFYVGGATQHTANSNQATIKIIVDVTGMINKFNVEEMAFITFYHAMSL